MRSSRAAPGNELCHTVGFSELNHGYINGDEQWHTAVDMTQTVGAFTYGNECSDCHSSELAVGHNAGTRHLGPRQRQPGLEHDASVDLPRLPQRAREHAS